MMCKHFETISVISLADSVFQKMTFFNQLKTLMWKNWTLRLKKPLRLVAELIWPLCIVIVLVWFKSKFKDDLKYKVKECHYEETSLPSAGLFSFLRSFICKKEGLCLADVEDGLQVVKYQNENWTVEDEVRHVFVAQKSKSIVDELIHFFDSLKTLDMAEMLRDMKTKMEMFKVDINNCSVPLKSISSQQFIEKYQYLVSSNILVREFYDFVERTYLNRDSWSLEELRKSICVFGDILHIPGNTTESTPLCEPDETFESVLNQFYSGFSFENLKLQLISCFTNASQLEHLFKKLQKISELGSRLNMTKHFLNQVTKVAQSKQTDWKSFSFERVMCGPTSVRFSSNTFTGFLTLEGIFETLKMYEKPTTNDNQGAICNAVSKYMPNGNLFIAGKIFFVPNTTETWKIIKLANETFENLKKMTILLYDVKHFISAFKNILIKSFLYRELQVALTLWAGFSNASDALFYQKLFGEDTVKSSLSDIIDRLQKILMIADCFVFDKFQSQKNEEELVETVMKQNPNETFYAGVVFDSSQNNTGSKHIRFKIRTGHSFRDYSLTQQSEEDPDTGSSKYSSVYMKSGFLFLQDIIEHAFLYLHTNEDEFGSILQQFPSPCYTSDTFKTVIIRIFPLFMTLAWIILVPIIVKDIVFEKEIKLKEFMKVMGLSTGVYWFSWFMFYIMSTFVTVLLLCLLLVYGEIFANASFSLLFCFMFIFVVAMVTHCFMYTVFFNKASTASVFSAICYFITYLPFRICLNYQNSLPLEYKLMASLSFTSAFGFGCKYLAVSESVGNGLQWDSIFQSPINNDNFNFAFCMLMMLVDTSIHIIITLYIDAISPGTYGVARDWYFPVQPLLNKFRKESNYSRNNPKFHETEEENVNVGVSAINLTKKFRHKSEPAVDNLKVSFYKNQITGLLGQNGAGKTTLMSIVTGLLSPTSGTVLINNLDVRYNIRKIQNVISFCPQHNILHEFLSVWQHLVFYARLKELSPKDVISECERVMSDMDLVLKKNVDAKHLSGGMKRRLSIGIAYLGAPEVIVLDEPTAGVDVFARRFIWDLLLKNKSNRTTILSTHLMDEADVLSDRLVIINKGKLCCSGSVMFLKKQFGKGYRLSIELDQNARRQNDKIVDKVKLLVKKRVPGAEEDTGFSLSNEVTFVLPQDDSSIKHFKDLFEDLDSEKSNLLIKSYGISSPTLEEIFLRVTAEFDDAEEPDTSTLEPSENTSVNNENTDLKQNTFEKAAGIKLWLNKTEALLVKRILYFRRNGKTFFCQIILPSIFLFLMLIMIALKYAPEDEDAVTEMHPWMHTAISKNTHFFVVRNRNLMWCPKQIEESFLQLPGLGNKCLNPSIHSINGLPCTVASTSLSNLTYPQDYKSNLNITCDCTKGFQRCLPSKQNQFPLSSKLMTNDILYNLTYHDPGEYILKTGEKLNRKLFGGFEFSAHSQAYLQNSSTATFNPIFHVLIEFFQFSDEIVLGLEGNVSLLTKNIISHIRLLAPKMLKEKLNRVWYNFRSPSSAVSYLNSMHNALLRSSLAANKNHTMDLSDVGMIISSKALNANVDEKKASKLGLDILTFVSILFSLSLIPPSFTFFLIQERESGFVHMQNISGVPSTLYWFCNLIWDLFTYIFAFLVCFMMFYMFNSKEYASVNNAPTFILLMFSYGWATIPLTYAFSYLFKDANNAYVYISSFYFFNGLITTMIVYISDLLNDEEEWSEYFTKIFIFSPQFCLGRGLIKMAGNQISYDRHVDVLGEGSVKFETPLKYSLTGRFISALSIFGAVALPLFFVAEYLYSCRIFNFFTRKGNVNFNNNKNAQKNEDVLQEEVRVDEERDSNILIVQKVSKTFSSIFTRQQNVVRAVDDVTFGVLKNECFGLLGLNGAGKTTLFKILTGQLSPSSGDVFVNDMSILRHRKEVQQQIGYCPQFDALCETMTVLEHLILFSKLRGASSHDVADVCSYYLQNLNLHAHEKTLAKNLSGGNRRKLATAMALIGNPKVIYLDEPTAGIDPGARRYVWNSIVNSLNEGCSVVLTSHSLEECESLCGRVTIMDAGQMRCIGSIQHLKGLYAQGYNLDLKFTEKSQKEANFLDDFQRENFPDAKLIEHHHGFAKYHLPLSSSSDLADMFNILLKAKSNNILDDFSLAQTKLEQIFLSFAKEKPSDD